MREIVRRVRLFFPHFVFFLRGFPMKRSRGLSLTFRPVSVGFSFRVRVAKGLFKCQSLHGLRRRPRPF